MNKINPAHIKPIYIKKRKILVNAPIKPCMIFVKDNIVYYDEDLISQSSVYQFLEGHEMQKFSILPRYTF